MRRGVGSTILWLQLYSFMAQWISALQSTKDLTVSIFYLKFKLKDLGLKLNWTFSKILSVKSTIWSTPASAEAQVEGVEIIEDKSSGKREKTPVLPVKQRHKPTSLLAQKQTISLWSSFLCFNNTKASKRNNSAMNWIPSTPVLLKLLGFISPFIYHFRKMKLTFSLQLLAKSQII